MPNIPGYNPAVSSPPALSVGWLPPWRVERMLTTQQPEVGVSQDRSSVRSLPYLSLAPQK